MKLKIALRPNAKANKEEDGPSLLHYRVAEGWPKYVKGKGQSEKYGLKMYYKKKS